MTRLCIVIGTGQNGTWAFAASASSKLPAIANPAARIRLPPGTSVSSSVGWVAEREVMG